MKAFSTSDMLSNEHACPAFACPLISKNNKAAPQTVRAFQAQHGPENRFNNRMSPAQHPSPTFYQIKKTPSLTSSCSSTSWAFQVQRRHENPSHYSYRASRGSGGAYRWVFLIVFLSFCFGFLVADIIYHLPLR